MQSALLTAVVCLGVLVSSAAAQQQNMLEQYAERDVLIPTRDGAKLQTKIFVPKNQTDRCRS